MTAGLGALGRGLLFRFDPETAHGLSLKALKTGLPLGAPHRASARLATRVAGIDFANPLGLAAGYDKNAEVPDALLALGFGFVECGTLTPRPQAGNPRPRIFRLTADRAVINRLGFNNDGHAAALARLVARRGRPGIVGVNIGANADSPDRVADYAAGVRTFASLASYLTVNISSPNTAGLRALQGADSLPALLAAVTAARSDATEPGARPVPLFLKIAPDLDEAGLDAIAEAVLAAGIEGVIVSNTTLARPPLESRAAGETGGLSGAPLFRRATAVLARMRRRVGPQMALVGAGGVESVDTALDKIRAGADLVQLYTGMIFAGPALPGRIVAGLDAYAARAGLERLSALRDSALDEWAAVPLE